MIWSRILVTIHERTRMELKYLSNTILFVGRGMSIVYCIRYDYMFRRLTTAIFRLYMKYFVSSYTRFIMGCIQWYNTRGEVGTRSRMCYGGWEVWIHGDAAILYYVYANLVIILCV